LDSLVDRIEKRFTGTTPELELAACDVDQIWNVKYRGLMTIAETFGLPHVLSIVALKVPSIEPVKRPRFYSTT